MIPAHQRLEAGDLGILEPHDRLVDEGEFLALDGAAQVRFDLQAVGAEGAEGGAERLDAVAAGLLGPVHGKLGIVEQARRILLLVDPGDEADGGRQDDSRGRRN
jgi:hypothetical protein